MAKPKQKAVKTPKKRSTKYGKLATVCSKELAAKKAALVRAEKLLAKAQRTHTELLSEVARLDMLDRSLKALINGTEAPQNVRYVYSYPQWVWYGNPYWNGNTWSLSLGNSIQNQPYTYANINGNFQGGQFTTTNAINTVNSGYTTVSTPTCTSGALTSSALTCDSGLSGLSLSNASLNNLSFSAPASTPSYTTTTTNAPTQPELTIDLSTGASSEEEIERELAVQGQADAKEVTHGS